MLTCVLDQQFRYGFCKVFTKRLIYSRQLNTTSKIDTEILQWSLVVQSRVNQVFKIHIEMLYKTSWWWNVLRAARIVSNMRLYSTINCL